VLEFRICQIANAVNTEISQNRDHWTEK